MTDIIKNLLGDEADRVLDVAKSCDVTEDELELILMKLNNTGVKRVDGQSIINSFNKLKKA
jgi:hypothetical protein